MEGLDLCGDTGPLSDKNYEKLVNLAFLVAIRQVDGQVETETIGSVGGDALQVKQIFAGLLTLVMEASRHDAKDRDLISYLDDRLSKERLEVFIAAHEKYVL